MSSGKEWREVEEGWRFPGSVRTLAQGTLQHFEVRGTLVEGSSSENGYQHGRDLPQDEERVWVDA